MSYGFQEMRELTRSTGSKIAKSVRDVQDKQLIDDIISNALKSNDPQVVQTSIGQILSQVSPERQPMAIKYLESVNQRMYDEQQKKLQRGALQRTGLDPYLPEGLQKEKFKKELSTQQRNEVFNKLAGRPVSELNRDELMMLASIPEMKATAEQALKRLDKAEEFYLKKEEKVAPIRSSLKTVDDLDKILEENYYSFGPLAGRINQTSNAREVRQQIVTLGNSLLQNAFKLPIRNQKEFEKALESLTNPTSTYSTNKGAVNALRKMLQAQLESQLGSDLDSSGSIGDVKKEVKGKVDQQAINELF